MQTQTNQGPWWAILTVWAVVNAVNVLQSAGYLSRIRTGSMATNSQLGYVMIGLAAPAGLALIAFVRTRAEWQLWIGPAVYLAFIALMIAVDYVSPVEFRSPARYSILVPYLVLFFGSILLMGIPMFRINRGLWMVTVASTVLLLSSMLVAMRKGVG
jgi:phosphatidylserine synthase